MFGLGKKRSPFGRFLDKWGVKQELVSRKSGVPNSTIGDWCDGTKKVKPIRKTASKALKAVKELTGIEVSYEDFWA